MKCGRWIEILLLVVCSISVAVESGPHKKRKHSKRACVDNYNVISWTKGPVWALGDIHGDLHGTLQLLRSVGLINDVSQWCGGESLLVQTGDLLDRGHHGVAAMIFFDGLREEARAAGGEVISLLGNHELMNLQGVFTYVTGVDLEHTGGHQKRRRLFSYGGKAFNLLKNYRTTVMVNDNIFVHAGIHPRFARYSLKQINKSVSRAISRENHSGNTLLTVEGPLWSRDLSSDDENFACSLLQETLNAYHAKRMIVGHTMQYYGISARCDGKLFVIDTGLSYAALKRPTILKISDQIVTGYEFYTTPLGLTVEVTVLHPSEEDIMASARASAAASEMTEILERTKKEKALWDDLVVPAQIRGSVDSGSKWKSEYELEGLDVVQLTEQLKSIDALLQLDDADINETMARDGKIPLESQNIPITVKTPEIAFAAHNLLASSSNNPEIGKKTKAGESISPPDNNPNKAELSVREKAQQLKLLIKQQLFYIEQFNEMRNKK